MTKMVVVSLPTRGEAPHLEAVARSYIELAADPEHVTVVVSVDNDDLAWVNNDDPVWPEGRVSAMQEKLGPRAIVSVAPREDCLGDKWNRALKVCPGDIYCVATDDNVVATKGWDEALRAGAALYPDDCGVIYYGEAPGAALPMCQAVTHGWADAFGGLYPSWFPFWFIDMWLDELAMMTGRMVWVDVAIRSCDGRGKTRGLRDVRYWNQFFDLTRPVREAQADQAIDELYKDMPWMAWRLRGKGRLALRTVFEGRSQFIYAEAVEAQATRATENPEDARYVRIKARADAYIQSLYAKAA